MRSFSRSLVVLLFLGACAPASPAPIAGQAAPIVDGIRELEEPAVVYVKIVGGIGACTGTLISPNVVLTAKHCVQGRNAEEPFSTNWLTVGFGNDRSDTEDWKVRRVATTPGAYMTGGITGLSGALVGVDVAVMTLAPRDDGSMPGVAPIPVRRDAPTDLVGQEVTFVGFGLTPEGESGIKYKGTGTIQQIEGGVLYSARNICSGDSGGPMIELTESGPRVVGVASFGSATSEGPACPSEQDGHNRVDLFLELIDAAMYEAGDCPVVAEEVCNSVDDDCDGIVDEGCKGLGDDCTTSDECAYARLPERFPAQENPVVCGDTPAGRVCTRACDPLAPLTSCASVEGAFGGASHAVTGAQCLRTEGCAGTCVPATAGVGGSEASCASTAECQPGLTCLDPGDGARRCVSMCQGGGDHCGVGEVCAAPIDACGGCLPEDQVVGPHGRGESCVAGSDCVSGVCVDDVPNGYCSTSCERGCPEGWHCRGEQCVRGRRQDGEACLVPEDCRSGECVVRERGAICISACDEEGACDEGFRCVEGLCEPGDGRVGATCDEHDGCDDGLVCEAVDGDRICTQPCGTAGTCPAGAVCVRSDAGQLRCALPRTGGGGCQALRGQPNPWVPLVFLGAWLLVRLRRRDA